MRGRLPHSEVSQKRSAYRGANGETMSALSPANRAEPRADLQAAPLIARVLRNEGYYGDGSPTWPGAPTSQDAQDSRKRYIKRLRRFSSEFPEAKELAKLLVRCKRRRRCMSGACPECGRAFQRFFVIEVKKLTKGESEQELASISIAFPKYRVPESRLNALDATSIKRSLSETIKDFDGLAWMAGGIDLSLNDDTLKGGGVFWQPQFYGFAAVTDPQALAQVLRNRFAASNAVPRPVQIKKCDGSAEAISYAFKTDFVRRIAYRAEIGPPGDRRWCWNTRKVSLRPREHVPAMLWMHKVGLRGRLFLHKVRMTRTGSRVALVQIKKLE
jgi:hypothetical protein